MRVRVQAPGRPWVVKLRRPWRATLALVAIFACAAPLIPAAFATAANAAAAAPASPASRTSTPPSLEALAAEVRETERAFAQTMADRDFARFASFISPEAIFFSGDRALRGQSAVTAAWKPFFNGKTAPFSWKPETVEVLSSGTLALSSGPVYDPAGKLTGTFTSTWRRDAPGVWHIIFDKGCDACAACGH